MDVGNDRIKWLFLMNEIFKKHLLVSTGAALIIVGVGPLLLADLARRLGFETVGFGLMWGLSFGAFFTIAGILVLVFAGVVKLFRLATGPNAKG
jgi:hypothetical protein